MNRNKGSSDSSMIIGLEGWGNAGEVSTMSISYLIEKLKAEKIGEIKPEGFYNYQINRPFVSVERGLIKIYQKSRNIIYKWESEDSNRVILLLKGVEPHLNWSKYADEILKASKKFGVNCIYTLGGYLTDSFYGREPIISGSTNNPERIEDLKRCRVELTSYRGPTSVYSEILWKSKRRGIDTVSLWAATPIYIRGTNPMVALHLLKTLLCLLRLEVNLDDMRYRARIFRTQLVKEAGEESKLEDLTGEWGSSEGSWDIPPYTI